MRREIWLGQSRGARFARWQQSRAMDDNHLCFHQGASRMPRGNAVCRALGPISTLFSADLCELRASKSAPFDS